MNEIYDMINSINGTYKRLIVRWDEILEDDKYHYGKAKFYNDLLRAEIRPITRTTKNMIVDDR